jgi:hypothetical protein
MRNFTTDLERYFAACVLDALIYRSKNQTIALIKQLFQRALPDLTRLDPTPLGQIEDWQERLHSQSPVSDPQIRLVAAVRKEDSPTKSAYVMARYMMQSLSIPKRWIIKPWEISRHIDRGINIFVFIDDFLGTGSQFKLTLTEENLAPHLSDSYMVYAPLVSHIDGIKSLRSQFKTLRLCPVEVLGESYSLFHPTSHAFNDQLNTPAGARRFYYQILRSKGIEIPRSERRGIGNLELAYAFEHATPDNCLPILWFREEPWQPLFENRA